MTQNQRPVVQTIIERFESQLSETAKKEISNAQMTELAMMIDAAITEEIAAAADLVEAVAGQLRASSRGAELGL